MIIKFFKSKAYPLNKQYRSISSTKLISPEIIQSEIQKLRIRRKPNFSNYMNFNKWTNSNEAINTFILYVDKQTSKTGNDYHHSEAIFEDLKLLLENTKLSPKPDDNLIFYSKLLKVLQKLYVDNFSSTTKVSLEYGLKCFSFIKTTLEQEYLISCDDFLDNFLILLSTCANLFVNQTYHKDLGLFRKNSNLMEEFLSRILALIDSKYILAYNPSYYYTGLNKRLKEIFNNIENLFLFLCLFKDYESTLNKIKRISLLIPREVINSRITDYINMFLIQNRKKLNIFYLIEVMSSMSVVNGSINKRMLNYLYDRTVEEYENKNLFNFPKDYLIDLAYIFSRQRVLGAFALIEKIIKVFLNKLNTEELVSYKDLATVTSSALRSGYNDKTTIDTLLHLIVKSRQFNSMDSVKIKHVKTLLERFINEEYENNSFIQYVFDCVYPKLMELKVLKREYNHEQFVELIKTELLLSKEKINVNGLSREDFESYYSYCEAVVLICLFKMNKEFEFKSQVHVAFGNGIEYNLI